MEVSEMLHARGYRLGSRIGKGSYAKVKLAERITDKKIMAAKIVSRRKAAKEFLVKFLPRELAVILTLSHRNIIKVYEMVQTEEWIFVLMEFAERGDLLDYIKRRGSLREERAGYIFAQVCEGVSYLHGRSICHRDLKCENVLLRRDMTVALSDFGFSRELPAATSLSTTYCGSAAYASPELLRGIPYKPLENDIWSLGCILFIMVTGQMPFHDKNTKKMMYRQLKGKPNFPENRNISALCKNLIGYMLEPNTGLRYDIKAALGHLWLQPYLTAVEEYFNQFSVSYIRSHGSNVDAPQTLEQPSLKVTQTSQLSQDSAGVSNQESANAENQKSSNVKNPDRDMVMNMDNSNDKGPITASAQKQETVNVKNPDSANDKNQDSANVKNHGITSVKNPDSVGGKLQDNASVKIQENLNVRAHRSISPGQRPHSKTPSELSSFSSAGSEDDYSDSYEANNASLCRMPGEECIIKGAKGKAHITKTDGEKLKGSQASTMSSTSIDRQDVSDASTGTNPSNSMLASSTNVDHVKVGRKSSPKFDHTHLPPIGVSKNRAQRMAEKSQDQNFKLTIQKILQIPLNKAGNSKSSQDQLNSNPSSNASHSIGRSLPGSQDSSYSGQTDLSLSGSYGYGQPTTAGHPVTNTSGASTSPLNTIRGRSFNIAAESTRVYQEGLVTQMRRIFESKDASTSTTGRTSLSKRYG